MKKKFLCLFLGIWLCLSFSLPLYALDGTINADDNAELVRPTLEMTTIPTGAAAVAYNLNTGEEYYYRMNGNILPSVDGVLSESGWMPETISTNYIFDADDMEKIRNTQEAPCCAIAYIHVEFSDGNKACGTAVMISPNAALTAAHCVYDKKSNRWPTRIKVYPATYGPANNQITPYGYALATEIVMSIPYHETKNSLNGDWAVMRLSSNIGNSSGFLGFQCATRNMEDMSVAISGYPTDGKNGYTVVNEDGKEVFIHTSYYQYWSGGNILLDTTPAPYVASNATSYQRREFGYRIDAVSGQSGAPILYYNNGSYQIIGMHIAGIPEGPNGENPYNMGFALTSQVFNFLWAYKNNA